jgi:hypothetical protein
VKVILGNDSFFKFLGLTCQRRLITGDPIALDQNGVCGYLHPLSDLVDVPHDDVRAGDLLEGSVLSQHDDLLVGALALLQLLELLLLRIVVTHCHNGDNEDCEEDRGALDPAVLEAVINNADD